MSFGTPVLTNNFFFTITVFFDRMRVLLLNVSDKENKPENDKGKNEERENDKSKDDERETELGDERIRTETAARAQPARAETARAQTARTQTATRAQTARAMTETAAGAQTARAQTATRTQMDTDNSTHRHKRSLVDALSDWPSHLLLQFKNSKKKLKIKANNHRL